MTANILAEHLVPMEQASTSQQSLAVPGASLLNRKPNELTVKELKRWLVCRGAVTTGKKADLVARLELLAPSGHNIIVTVRVAACKIGT